MLYVYSKEIKSSLGFTRRDKLSASRLFSSWSLVCCTVILPMGKFREMVLLGFGLVLLFL